MDTEPLDVLAELPREYLEQRHRALLLELAALRKLLDLPPLRTQNRRHKPKNTDARADRETDDA